MSANLTDTIKTRRVVRFGAKAFLKTLIELHRQRKEETEKPSPSFDVSQK